MSTEGIVAIVVAALGAIASAIVVVLNARHKNRTESKVAEHKLRLDEDQTAIGQWRELHEIHQQQLERQEKHIAEQGKLIDELFVADSECQIAFAQQYGTLEWMYDSLTRASAILKKHGLDDLGQLPVLPPRPQPRRSRQRTEFLTRQTAQETENLAKISEEISKHHRPLEG